MSRGGEAALQAHIVKLLEHLGFKVWRTSQYRRANVTAGLPDLYALHPQTGGVWIEVKAPDGVLSPAQLDFQAACRKCDVWHVAGGEAEVESFLRGRGLWL